MSINALYTSKIEMSLKDKRKVEYFIMEVHERFALHAQPPLSATKLSEYLEIAEKKLCLSQYDDPVRVAQVMPYLLRQGMRAAKKAEGNAAKNPQKSPALGRAGKTCFIRFKLSNRPALAFLEHAFRRR